MGALLERHGIGNGKYKVGGEIDDTILSTVYGKGSFQNISTIVNPFGTTNPLTAVEIDNNDNFYVGTNGGSPTLIKFNAAGTELWRSSASSKVTCMKVDPFTNNLWVIDGAVNVTIYNPSGSVITTFPYSVSVNNTRNIAFSENEVFIGVNLSADSVMVYNKSGVFVRNINVASVFDVKVYQNSLYTANPDGIQRRNFDGTVVWSLPFVKPVASSGRIVVAAGQLLHVQLISPGATAVTDYLVIDLDGNQLQRKTRTFTSTNYNIGTNDPNTRDIVQTFNAQLACYDGLAPVAVSTNTTSNTGTYRKYNNFGEMTLKVDLSGGILNLTNGGSSIAMSKNGIVYAVTTGRNVLILDSKIYYRINR